MDENNRNLWRQITSKRSKNIFSNTFFYNVGGVSCGNNKVAPSVLMKRRTSEVISQRERLEVENFVVEEVSFNEDDITPVMDAETHDMAKLGDYPTDDKQPKEMMNSELNDFDVDEQEEVKIKFEAEGEE